MLTVNTSTDALLHGVQTILPRDLAQLVAMGADAVHPILPLDMRTTSHVSEGLVTTKQRAENVLNTFKKGLNLFCRRPVM